MKNLLRWVAFTVAIASAQAALLAHIDTTLGRVTVELQYDTAPQNVSNFILLSQGQRARIDFLTGAVTTDPLYVGETFFRTANNSFAKFAQTGSGTGSNTGNTGYTLKDEFSPTTRHTGYTLSMANSGPNTNAGQVFLTGNISIPAYDDVHTIIGLVPDSASRAVIDAIIAAGDNGSSITAVTIERTDPAAQAFDETAQNLPEVVKASGTLQVERNVATDFLLSPLENVGSVVSAFRSTDLATWSRVTSRHVGIGTALASPVLPGVNLDDASANRAFYNLAVARHPGAVGPSHFRNRTLTAEFSTSTQIFTFNADGTAGSLEVILKSDGTSIPGTFTLFDLASSAHACTLILPTSLGIQSNFWPQQVPYVPRLRCGWNTADSTSVTGTHISEFFDNYAPASQSWQANGSGTCSSTR
ncbi:peptidylprolyl isomerase [Haloferula sp. A504]|uniref:peptidylprolyl isomerase n=1 Tax=Haloferula sp. A504 TaxID=3373601 RepID=UPI0031C2B704|nr:peptidylprolyl isomerase [Verrucomicrobiaceae bacterium E54]